MDLPKSTELNKMLAKADIYKKFGLSAKEKEIFDNDISRLYINNEISPRTLALEKGQEVGAIFVLLVQLKTKDFEEKNIHLLAKLIPQKMLFVLEFDKEVKFAVCLPDVQNNVLQSAWIYKDNTTNFPKFDLQNTHLDTIWEKLVLEVGNITLEKENSLEEQIQHNTEQEKTLKKIATLEKKARTEKQPKKKLEILEEVRRLRGE